MLPVNEMDVIWYKKHLDGYVVVNRETGLFVGSFCTERAVKEFALNTMCIARRLT